MNKLVQILVFLVISIASISLPLPASAGTLFRDDFSGGMSGSWTIIRPDPSYYSFQPTYLDLRANYGDLWGGMNSAKNLFLINTPTGGDFVVNLRLNQFIPTSNYAQIDILAYDTDDNHVRDAYCYVDGTKLEFGKETSGSPIFWDSPMDFGSNPFYLRLTKVGDTYTQYYSTDGVNFFNPLGSFTYGDGTPEWLGFVAMCDWSQSTHAHVDYFEVTTLDVAPLPPVFWLMGSGLALLAFRRIFVNK